MKIKVSNHQIEKLKKQRDQLSNDINSHEQIIAKEKKELELLDNTIAGMKALNGGEEKA